VKERKTAITPEHITQTRSAFLIEWKIITPAIANFLQVFTFGAIVAFVPLYAFQCGVTNPGLFFTANAVVIMAGRIFGGKILDTYNKEKMILAFIFVNMVTMIILSFSKTLPMFIFAGLLWGTGGAFFMPASMAHAFDYAGSSNATAVGTFQAFTDLGMALGPAIMGMVVPLMGYPIMFLCLAFICFIDLCYFQFYVRKRNN
jgi:MFS family permease